MEWRKINQVDRILDKWTPPEVLAKYYSIGLSGNDKFGCPGNKTYFGNYLMKYT